MHEGLCPYCSFNRYAFREDVARPYFEHMRREMLMVKELGYDIESIYCGGGTPTILLVEVGCKQTTFSPLYVSSATSRKMQQTLGKMDWDREYAFYRIIDDTLAGGDAPLFHRSTIWTFSRNDGTAAAAGVGGAGDMVCGGRSVGDAAARPARIEEYQTNYDEYPAIGSGSVTHLNGCLYVNNFSIKDYNAAIDAGRMSIMGKSVMSKRDLMRYSFLVELYKLRLDKRAFARRYGCDIDEGLPMEMAFMRLNKAFATDDEEELTFGDGTQA